MHGGSFSFSTRRFTDKPDGPGNDWSCVILNFGMWIPCSLMVSCSWQPRGAMDAFGIYLYSCKGSGSAKPFTISSLISLSKTCLFLIADWWLPRFAWKSKSRSLSWWDIGVNGKVAPNNNIFLNFSQRGWSWRSSCNWFGFLNSEPNITWLWLWANMASETLKLNCFKTIALWYAASWVFSNLNSRFCLWYVFGEDWRSFNMSMNLCFDTAYK